MIVIIAMPYKLLINHFKVDKIYNHIERISRIHFHSSLYSTLHLAMLNIDYTGEQENCQVYLERANNKNDYAYS